jgi:hypothetical protein
MLEPIRPSEGTPNRFNEFQNLLKTLILIGAIYLYFIGWVYLHSIYFHFGIPLYSLDIPFYYYFVYSFYVLGWWVFYPLGLFHWSLPLWNWGVWLVFIISIILLSLPWTRKKKRLVSVCLIIAVVFSYWLTALCGEKFAEGMRNGEKQPIGFWFYRDYAQQISFAFKEEVKKGLSQEFIDANDKSELRLITLTKDGYFVLFQPQKRKDKLESGVTYEIAKKDIYSSKISLPDVPK